MRLGLAALAALPLAAAAEPVEVVGYDRAAALTTGLVDFETLPSLPEPGHALDHGYAFAGGRAGERFAGQPLIEERARGGRHDTIPDTTAPAAPLALLSGAPQAGLSVSFHRAFGSNALYPVGPLRWPAPEARGEGAAAFLFDDDGCAVALRVHTEYRDDLGSRADHRGLIRVRLYARDATLIADRALWLGPGISSFGFLRAGGRADIAGLLLTNLDPGGVSMDDLRFGCAPAIG
ncbi:hypothetical protein SAMN05444722_3659 [Rhodovulum sp. ES.010]|uniref:hypothetical protein n=1 Tax=Rhodovulum sp. ES.010 TaxID=1882821 RepID=UPI00092913AD|nr:hypothetical protein [Rhodovulum sp. ES.010]SIO56883.1 hypothetical protein SAMN05444722_3659 [Rhodovulum sp. ES.010]